MRDSPKHNGNYRADRTWSDQFIPGIRNIVGPRLLRPASLYLDQRENTDLTVLNARDMRVAARIRRPGYAGQFHYDFTIRADRPTGAKTELQKILEGFGDWFFYGHQAKKDSRRYIHPWLIIDLDKFYRQLRESDGRAGRPRLNRNPDGTQFIAFDIRDFRPGVVLHSSGRINFDGYPQDGKVPGLLYELLFGDND